MGKEATLRVKQNRDAVIAFHKRWFENNISVVGDKKIVKKKRKQTGKKKIVVRKIRKMDRKQNISLKSNNPTKVSKSKVK